MAFEQTQNKLDELRNLTWQNGQLIKMLSQGGDTLALNREVQQGKQSLVDAIEYKGGTSNADKSFQGIAQDIEDIPNFPTTGFEYISEIYRPRTLMEVYNSRCYLKSIVNNTIEEISGAYTFSNCTSLVSVQLPNLAVISGAYMFNGCTSLVSVQLPNLAVISGAYMFNGCTSLVSVQLPNLTEISANTTFYTCTSLLNVQLPNLTVISANSTFRVCTSLQNVQFGSLGVCLNPFHSPVQNLRNITIQDANINLPFQYWTATNVINEGQSGIDELNSNLYNNLLTKLYDHSEDGEERTLRLGWYNYVSEENKLYAKNKGWNITS